MYDPNCNKEFDSKFYAKVELVKKGYFFRNKGEYESFCYHWP